MQHAIAEAAKAVAMGEVPIGAVVVKDGSIIGRGHNHRESWNDPTAHAEILAIRQAAAKTGSWRLTGASLYVTLEPCPMCAGAIVNARLHQVVFAAYDSKAGAVSSLFHMLQDQRLNHQAEVLGGICEQECSEMLQLFFRRLRNRN